MQPQVNALYQLISDQLAAVADSSIDDLKERCHQGVAFWSDLSLEEIFHTLGLSEQQVESICDESPWDKTAVLQALLDELSKSTLVDGLTDIYNRRYFERNIESELERSRREQKPCGLVLLDIDHFKGLNDAYGHDFGDEVLKTVAKTIQATLRSSDTISRVGGEEFAIIAPNIYRSDAVVMTERVRKSVELLFFNVDGVEIRVTISIGVSINNPKQISSLDELYKEADKALYQAKNAGRNCVRFSGAIPSETASAVTPEERNELLG